MKVRNIDTGVRTVLTSGGWYSIVGENSRECLKGVGISMEVGHVPEGIKASGVKE